MAQTTDTPPDSSPPRKAGGRAAAATYASYLGVSTIGLANVLLVSRVLGPAGRGEVVFLMTVAGISGYLFNLSVQEANANLSGLKAHRRPSLGTNSILLSVALGLLAAGAATLALAYAPFLSEDVPASHLIIALASIPSVTLQTYLVYLARGSYQFTIANLSMLVAPVVSILANAILALTGTLSVTTALLSWSVGLGLSATVLVVDHALRVGYGRADPGLAREAVSFGAKSHVGGVLATGSYRMDQWILGAVAGPRELGLYSVAVAWFEGLFLLPMAIGAVARPDLVLAKGAEAGRRAAMLFRVTLVVTTVFAIGLIIAAPLLCTVLFGEEFSGSVEPLRLLAVGSLGIVGAKVIGVALIAQRRPLLESASMGLGFVVAIALYVLLIPSLGADGAAIGSAVAYTVAGVASAAFLVRAFGVPIVELVPRPSDVRAIAELASRALPARRPPG
jgi:O-antigen/teichoic acid export membrane protein